MREAVAILASIVSLLVQVKELISVIPECYYVGRTLICP